MVKSGTLTDEAGSPHTSIIANALDAGQIRAEFPRILSLRQPSATSTKSRIPAIGTVSADIPAPFGPPPLTLPATAVV